MCFQPNAPENPPPPQHNPGHIALPRARGRGLGHGTRVWMWGVEVETGKGHGHEPERRLESVCTFLLDLNFNRSY